MKENGEGKKFIAVFSWVDLGKENWWSLGVFFLDPPKYFLRKLDSNRKENMELYFFYVQTKVTPSTTMAIFNFIFSFLVRIFNFIFTFIYLVFCLFQCYLTFFFFSMSFKLILGSVWDLLILLKLKIFCWKYCR